MGKKSTTRLAAEAIWSQIREAMKKALDGMAEEDAYGMDRVSEYIQRFLEALNGKEPTTKLTKKHDDIVKAIGESALDWVSLEITKTYMDMNEKADKAIEEVRTNDHLLEGADRELIRGLELKKEGFEEFAKALTKKIVRARNKYKETENGNEEDDEDDEGPTELAGWDYEEPTELDDED